MYRDGRARARRVRTRGGGERELCPQRVVCRRCGRVNVVLPAWCVPGRCDDAETIGTALVAAAEGRGHRSIAVRLGLPATTVRGWLRAARSHAEALRVRATVRQYEIEFGLERLRRSASSEAVCVLPASGSSSS